MAQAAEHEQAVEAEVAQAEATAAPALPLLTGAPPGALQVQRLQRAVGNRATRQILARRGTVADLEQLSTGGTAREIAAAGNISQATHDQRIGMLERLNAQGRPTQSMLRAMETLWRGLGASYHVSHEALYRSCAAKGARLPRLMPGDELLLMLETRPGVLTEHQVNRVGPALNRLSVDDYLRFRKEVERADSDVHRAFLWKALAARRSITDIERFAFDIWLMDEPWLLANLGVIAETTAQGSTGRGISQQWQMSCGPTTVQSLRAQADPVYALWLHNGGDVSPQDQSNARMTAEQGSILQSQGSTPTPIGTSGGGAWVESNMNANARTTGVRYTFRHVTGTTGNNPANGRVDRAWRSICGFLDQGIHIPLLIGGSPGHTAHYVLAMRRDGQNMQVHDPGSGTTAWITYTQFMNNSMNPPLSWNFFAGWDVPRVQR